MSRAHCHERQSATSRTTRDERRRAIFGRAESQLTTAFVNVYPAIVNITHARPDSSSCARLPVAPSHCQVGTSPDEKLEINAAGAVPLADTTDRESRRPARTCDARAVGAIVRRMSARCSRYSREAFVQTKRRLTPQRRISAHELVRWSVGDGPPGKSTGADDLSAEARSSTHPIDHLTVEALSGEVGKEALRSARRTASSGCAGWDWLSMSRWGLISTRTILPSLDGDSIDDLGIEARSSGYVPNRHQRGLQRRSRARLSARLRVSSCRRSEGRKPANAGAVSIGNMCRMRSSDRTRLLTC